RALTGWWRPGAGPTPGRGLWGSASRTGSSRDGAGPTRLSHGRCPARAIRVAARLDCCAARTLIGMIERKLLPRRRGNAFESRRRSDTSIKGDAMSQASTTTRVTRQRRPLILFAAGLIALTALFALPSSARPAGREKADSPKPTIVLVHGDWADASSWSAEIQRLQSRGYTVV